MKHDHEAQLAKARETLTRIIEDAEFEPVGRIRPKGRGKKRLGITAAAAKVKDPDTPWINFHHVLGVVIFAVAISIAYAVLVARDDSARLAAVESMEAAKQELAEVRIELRAAGVAAEEQRVKFEAEIGRLETSNEDFRKDIARAEALRATSAEIDRTLLSDIDFLMKNEEAFEPTVNFLGHMHYVANSSILESDEDFIRDFAAVTRKWVEEMKRRHPGAIPEGDDTNATDPADSQEEDRVEDDGGP